MIQKLPLFLSIAALQLITSATLANTTNSPYPTPPPETPKEIKLVNTFENAEKEHLLADSTGRTLYVFDNDLNQTTPTCNAACAEVWPPYLIAPDEAQDLKAPLGKIVRANKKIQLTYDNRPVYLYAFDRGVNAEDGDGVGGVWHYIEVKE